MSGGYEAIMALPYESSSVVQAFKTLRFPPNKKGEVTDEDFELLKQHGHIGEGRLQVVEDFLKHETDFADQMPSDALSDLTISQFKNKVEFAIA
jgi:hypothetical protein